MRGAPKWLHRAAATVALAVAALAWPAAARALVIDAGDGLGNVEAPDDLQGWANIGRRLGGPSVVYLGDRWVLTADHVGAGVIELAGERFDPIAETLTPIHNPDGSRADLLLFRIDRDPGLDPLPLARTTPPPGTDVVLVGMGGARGSGFTVDSPRLGLLDGWLWVPDGTKRWGTNRVSGPVRPVEHRGDYTLAIPTLFERIDDPDGTAQEAAAALGDSGGALFAPADGRDEDAAYELAGLIFSVSHLSEAPASSTLYGSATYAADLASYRDQVIAAIRPACANERDDDGDGRVDHPDDPGCDSARDAHEDGGTARARRTWLAMLAFGALLGWRLRALWRARHSGVT